MKNRQTLKTSLILVISCLCILLPDFVNAQDRNIFEISGNTSLNIDDRQDFYNLAFNLNTTVYLKDNSVQNTYGNGSIIKVTMQDTESFDLLKTNQSQYNQAELITIHVNNFNELNKNIDLTSLTEMKGLKYIFIECLFKCQLQDVQNFVKANPNVRVFYIAQKPS